MSLYGMREIEKRLEAEQRGELASLRAEVERLKAERDEARAVRDHFGERALYWSEREAKARAERDAIERATIELCEQECINQRDAAQLALMRLGEHETVAIACAKSRVKQAHDCAAAMRALKERQGG